MQTDASVRADVENLVGKTIDEFGVIDILVNDAATTSKFRGPFVEHPEEVWDTKKMRHPREGILSINPPGGCFVYIAEPILEELVERTAAHWKRSLVGCRATSLVL